MYRSSEGWGAAIIVFGLVCGAAGAIIGWGLIEFLIWFFSHISFNF